MRRRKQGMKKYFLTTAMMGTLVAPAFGEDIKITESSTCNIDVLGTSENNATANAIATWVMNKYTLNPGEYLYVNGTEIKIEDCISQSYCPGGEYNIENATESIKSCPKDFPSSEKGAGYITQCFSACDTTTIPKASEVTGGIYYGGNTKTCKPTACVAGWHVKQDTLLTNAIGSDSGTDSAYINHYGTFNEQNFNTTGPKGKEYYGMSGNNSFAINYSALGILTGRSICSTSGGVSAQDNPSTPDKITIKENLADETGTTDAVHCYCQIESFKPIDGYKLYITSAPWALLVTRQDSEVCAKNCAYMCSNNLRNNTDTLSVMFRTAIFNATPALPAICTANKINIEWDPDNNAPKTKNTCTYEGKITLPSTPVKPGYEFVGWKVIPKGATE